MEFRYIGKRKLLEILKKQSQLPHINLTDVQYYREEHYSYSFSERIVYFEDRFCFRVEHRYLSNKQKIVLIFTVKLQTLEDEYIIEQETILKEKEIK